MKYLLALILVFNCLPGMAHKDRSLALKKCPNLRQIEKQYHYFDKEMNKLVTESVLMWQPHKSVVRKLTDTIVYKGYQKWFVRFDDCYDEYFTVVELQQKQKSLTNLQQSANEAALKVLQAIPYPIYQPTNFYANYHSIWGDDHYHRRHD